MSDYALTALNLMELYGSHTETVNTLWNIYLIVAFGLLGFVYKDGKLKGNWKLNTGLSVGFIIFAGGNLAAMKRSQEIICEVAKVLNKIPDAKGVSASIGGTSLDPLFLAFQAFSVEQLMRAHLVFSALVVVGIWLPFLLQTKQPYNKS